METSLERVQQADSSRELEVRKKRLRDNCREFESVMISYMMKTMQNGVRWGEEPDSAKAMYEDMLTQQVAREVGRSSVLGIGDMLYSKLEPLLEKQIPKKPEDPRGDSHAVSSPPSADKHGVVLKSEGKSMHRTHGYELLNRSRDSADK